jgi:hypothetical protein
MVLVWEVTTTTMNFNQTQVPVTIPLTPKTQTLLSKKLSQWVGFNAVGNKNSLSFGIDVGFKFSKLPWTLNECVRTNLTCANWLSFLLSKEI